MKSVAATLAGASILAMSLLAASPASAAGNAIDPGDSLYAISCDNDYNDWQVFGVDPTTAFSTPIGDGSGGVEEDGCAAQPAYNPATGKSYYIQWSEDHFLAEVDVVTGESAVVGDFYYDNGEFPESINVNSLAIGADGSAFVLDFDGYLWSVDLDTAWVTPIGQSVSSAWAFAADPVTGKFYAITYDNDLYEIDVTDGSTNFIDNIVPAEPQTAFYTYSLQFDGAGTFWIEADGSDGDNTTATLWSFTLETLDAPVYSGIFTDDPFYTEAILIIPGDVVPVEPALAATGADLADVIPWGVGAAAIVLAGGVLMIVRSRRASAAAE